MNILWNGPYKYPDSYSNTARNILMSLYKKGVNVRLMKHPLPQWENKPFALPEEVADVIEYMEHNAIGSPSDTALFQFCVPQRFLYEANAAKNIGYTMFETNMLPRSWVVPCMSQDEIWNPTRWGAHTFASTGLAKQNIRVLPIGYDPEIFKPSDEKLDIPELEGKKVFGACFDWTPRKNGLQTIGAFLKAFEGRDDVVLLLKCYFKPPIAAYQGYLKQKISEIRQELNIHGKPNIAIYSDIIPDWEMGKFYNSIDFHVSVTHGEGFNKPVLEAMACGVPSIVTMWGGQLEFCNADNSLLVSDCPLGGINPEQQQICGPDYQGMWALPSFVNIVENLRYADAMGTESLTQISENCLTTAKKFTNDKIIDIFLKNLEGTNES